MSLRFKIVAIVAFGFLALSTTVFFYARQQVEAAFSQFEVAAMADDARFIGDAYNTELETLLRFARDLGQREIVFQLDPDQPMVEAADKPVGNGDTPAAGNGGPNDAPAGAAVDRHGEQPLDHELAERRVSFVAITNKLGDLVYSRRFDLEKKAAGSVAETTLAFIRKDSHLRVHHHADSGVAGLALLEEAPVLVVSAPILPAAQGGLIQGAVIVGRDWRFSDFNQVAYRNKLAVFHQRADGQLSPDMRAFMGPGRTVGTHETRLLGEGSVAAYALLGDIYGKPALVVRLAKRRQAATEALRCSARIAGLSLAVGGGLFILMIGLLESMVMARLRALVREVKQMKTATHLTDVSITVRGGDEVGKIAHGMRYLLDALKTNRYRWMRAEKRMQELLEMSPTPLLLVEPANGRLYRINDAALTLLGASRKQLSGRKVDAIFASLDGQTGLDDLAARLGEEMRDLPGVVKRSDGTTLAVDVRAATIRQPDGEVIVFTFNPTRHPSS